MRCTGLAHKLVATTPVVKRSAHTRMAASAKLVHYDSKTCPFAQRSWITLLEKQLLFEIRHVAVVSESEEVRQLYASIHPDPAASPKIPILIDGPTKLIESLVVMEYLASQYADSGTQVLPASAAATAMAKLWIEFYSSAVTGNVFGLLRADSKAAVAEAKAKLVDGMKVAEACLLRQGNDQGGDYFLGGQFTIADIATVTFLQRSLVVLPAYRDVDMWAIMEEHNLGRLQRWAKAVLARPAAMETRPADDVMVKSWGKIVAAMKD